MTLTDQVISLNLAKRLKELGVKQESLCYYQGTAIEIGAEVGYVLHVDKQFQWEGVINVAAFTVAELGEMLPAELPGNWLLQMAPAFKNIKAWVLWYEDAESPEKMMLNGNHWTISAKTEAEARGLMLAYLIENNLISV